MSQSTTETNVCFNSLQNSVINKLKANNFANITKWIIINGLVLIRGLPIIQLSETIVLKLIIGKKYTHLFLLPKKIFFRPNLNGEVGRSCIHKNWTIRKPLNLQSLASVSPPYGRSLSLNVICSLIRKSTRPTVIRKHMLLIMLASSRSFRLISRIPCYEMIHRGTFLTLTFLKDIFDDSKRCFYETNKLVDIHKKTFKKIKMSINFN